MDAGARHRYAELVEAPDSKGLLPLLSAATLRAPDVRLRLHRNGCCIHSALPFKWERLPAVWLLLLRLGRKWLSTHVHLISSSCHKRVFTHAPLSSSTHGRSAKRLFVRRYCAMETACHKFWNNGATPCGSLSKQTVVKWMLVPFMPQAGKLSDTLARCSKPGFGCCTCSQPFHHILVPCTSGEGLSLKATREMPMW